MVLPKGFAAMLWQRKPKILFARVQVAAVHPAKAKKDTGGAMAAVLQMAERKVGPSTL